MNRSLLGCVGAVLVMLASGTNAIAAEEVSLFSGDGTAAAYVDVDDELTIYLWDGKPVAHLQPNGDVYGFNGKHLGWFENGVVWNHNGNVSCAAKQRLKTAQFEPFKSFKRFRPFKAFKEFAPARPAFSGSFGDLPCDLLLGAGAAD